MDYLTLKPGSMDYLASAKPTSLEYFSAYANMLDRTRMYFQGLPQMRPYEGRVATAAELGPLLPGGREREIPLDLSIRTIRQTPDSTAVDDDVIVLEHKKAAAARQALSKLQAEAARHGARLGEAFLPPVGAAYPHGGGGGGAAGKKACHPHNIMASSLAPYSSCGGAAQTSTVSVVSQAGSDALVTHLPTHLNMMPHTVHHVAAAAAAAACNGSDGALCVDFPRCRTGGEFIPTSLGSLAAAAQHPMHRAQTLQTMAALGGLHGLTSPAAAAAAAAAAYDRGVPKLVPLCPSQNTQGSALPQELTLSELHRLGLAAGAGAANFLLPPSCAGAMGMAALSKQMSAAERYGGPMAPPPPGYPKENACPCCPPTGLPIPCACCVPSKQQQQQQQGGSSRGGGGGAGAFSAYGDACCPPSKDLPAYAAMSALYNGAFSAAAAAAKENSNRSSSSSKELSSHVHASNSSSSSIKRDPSSSSFSSSSTQASGIKGSSSSSNAKDNGAGVVVAKEASLSHSSNSSSSSSLSTVKSTSTSSSTTTTLTSSTSTTAASSLPPADSHHHHHSHHSHHSSSSSSHHHHNHHHHHHHQQQQIYAASSSSSTSSAAASTKAEPSSAKVSRASEGCARTDGRDKRSMNLAQKEMESAARLSAMTAAAAGSSATSPATRVYAPLASIPAEPSDQHVSKDQPDLAVSAHGPLKPIPTYNDAHIKMAPSSSSSSSSSPEQHSRPRTASPLHEGHHLPRSSPPHPFPSAAPLANYPPRDPLHARGPPAAPKEASFSPAKAEEASVRKHPGVVTVWRPGNWDDEPPKYPSPQPKEAAVPSTLQDKAAPTAAAAAPTSPCGGATLPEAARGEPQPAARADDEMLLQNIQQQQQQPDEEAAPAPEEQVLSAEHGPSAFLPPPEQQQQQQQQRKLSVVEELVQKYRKKYVENRMLQRLLVNIKRPKPPTCSGAVLPYLIADKKGAGGVAAAAKRKSGEAEQPTHGSKRSRAEAKEHRDHQQKIDAGSSVHRHNNAAFAHDSVQATLLYQTKVQDGITTTTDDPAVASDDYQKRHKSKRLEGIWRKRHERIQKIIIKMRANTTHGATSALARDPSADGGAPHPALTGPADGSPHRNAACLPDPYHRPQAPGDEFQQPPKEHYESSAVLDSTEKLIVRLYYGRKRFGFGSHRRRHCRSGFDYIRPKKKAAKKFAYEAHPKHEMTLEADQGFKGAEDDDGCCAAPDAKGEEPLDGSNMKLVSPSQGRSPICVPLEMKRLMINKTLGETVLHRAARQGYTEVVIYCLETKYVEIDAKDNAGYTPLHECCARGHLQIARYLLQYGADVNVSAAGGIRPIHDAVENDHLEIVRLLLSYGADPLLATYSGLTPVKIAHSLAMQEFLLGYLADVTGETDRMSPWQFYGSGRFFDPVETGFDIFDDLPSDVEDVDHNDITFEISDRPHIQTFLLNHSSCHGPETYCWLEDVLRQTGQDREHFLLSHANACVVALPRSEFVQSVESSQVCAEAASLLADTLVRQGDGNALIEMVRLDDPLRHMLGVETVVISTHE